MLCNPYDISQIELMKERLNKREVKRHFKRYIERYEGNNVQPRYEYEIKWPEGWSLL